MYRWTQFPFLRLTFFLILGILFARVLDSTMGHISPNLVASSLLGILFLFGISLIFFRKNLPTVSGHLLLLSFFLVGLLVTGMHTIKDEREASSVQFSEATAYTAQVVSYPVQKEKYFVHEIESIHYLVDTVAMPIKAKIQLLEKRTNDQQAVLKYGDRIIVQGRPFPIQKPKNPHEFDYAEYMADQNIFFQQFPESDEITLLGSAYGNPVLAAIFRLRETFESTIKSAVKGKDEQGVALALLLGIKDFLDFEVKQAFAASGALHVLAVSGLHVGVVYMILLWLFKPFKHPIISGYALPILSLLVLWLYAMLTGFSPSILRAVAMFSVVIVGRTFHRSANIYNSLAVSAFILLITNPNYLFAVGFQLSYLAVIGIVYLYDGLYGIWETKSWIMNKVWALLCVSMAAQIATAPISIYYFHQFPTYFLLSNLIVIPLSFAIMVLGVMVLVLKGLPFVELLGHLLEFIIWFLNRSVEFIFELKWSVIDWLYLSLNQTWLLYLSIVLLCAFLYTRKIKYLWSVCVVFLVISIEGSASLILQSQEKQTILYATRENQLMDKIDGLHAQLSSLDTVGNLGSVKYHVEPNRQSNHLPPVENVEILKSTQGLIQDFACLNVHNDLRYLHVFKSLPIEHIRFTLDTDYLIVANNSFKSFKDISDYIQFKYLIIDQSNSRKVKNELKKEASKNGIQAILLDEQSLIVSGN